MRKPPRQRMYAISIDDGTSSMLPNKPTTPFFKVVGMWIPRRFVTDGGVNLEEFLSAVNEIVTQRGFVLSDGQLVTIPLSATETIDLVYEGNIKYDSPPHRDWCAAQREYFGLQNPYQMSEDDDYTQSHIVTRIFEPYLFPDERIAAILHGKSDEYYFYCPCHQADVGYTTRHRLVCMGCGALHVVFPGPLPVRTKRLLTAEEWADFFDDDGSRRDEEVDLGILDFRDVENATTIWATDQWEEAKHRFIFFARSSPEVIEETIRGTEADPSIFREAGFREIELAPPPAHQVLDDSVDVDLLENAAHSLHEGVARFLAARTRPESLLNSIPKLFTALELLLKVKLQSLDAHSLDDRPDNPTVLKRIRAKGDNFFVAAELETVTRLRRLRNNLQHGTCKLNYRTGLALCRRAIVLLDRFAKEELSVWIGDVVSPDDWAELVKIPEIAATSGEIVKKRIEEVRKEPEAVISVCPRCRQEALARPHPSTGASCMYCHYIPVSEDKSET